MSVNISRLGVVAAFVPRDDQVADGCTIWLSQASTGARYLFVVKVRVGEGIFELGRFYTAPPADGSLGIGSAKSRAVAIASCPGAREWMVEVQAALGFEGEVDAAASQDAVVLSIGCCSAVSPAGVQRVNERPKYYSGESGTVDVLPGEVVTGWTAWAPDDAGLVNYSDPEGTQIIIPPSGVVSGGTAGIVGPAQINFDGTGGYYVEVLQSA